MGLDMYLEAETYISDYFSKNQLASEVVKLIGIEQYLDDKSSPSLNVRFKIGYWRKANAIHKWFVDNVQGGVDECQLSPVAREELVKLRDLCQDVCANPESASDLLPTENGFFFGSTEYDEMYFEDIKDTVNIINRCLEMDEAEYVFYYRASW